MRLIRAGNASEWTGPTGNNTYLFAGSPSVLVDAGVGGTEHLREIEDALDGRPLEIVLVTHAHPDHVSGVDALRKRWPGLRVLKHPPGVDGPIDALRDGMVVEAGGTRLRAVHTPGHSPDHCGFLDERTGDLFCGDLVRLGGTIASPASRGGNLIEYLASLRRVRELGAARLLPGHGPAIDHPASVIDEYIRRRAEREASVLAALAAGTCTVEEIADRVYGRLHPAIAPAARDMVQAHLVKLAAEGRAAASPDGWRPTAPQAG